MIHNFQAGTPLWSTFNLFFQIFPPLPHITLLLKYYELFYSFFSVSFKGYINVLFAAFTCSRHFGVYVLISNAITVRALDSDGFGSVGDACSLWPWPFYGCGRFGDKSRAKRSRRRRRRRGGGPANDDGSTTILLISSADETERNVAKKYGRRGRGPVGRRQEGEGEIPATFFFFSDLFICSVYLIRRSRTGAVRRRVVNRTCGLAEDTVAR